VAINISPLCGDESVHILQRTNQRTFEAKPSYDKCDLDVNEKIHPDGASVEELASI